MLGMFSANKRVTAVRSGGDLLRLSAFALYLICPTEHGIRSCNRRALFLRTHLFDVARTVVLVGRDRSMFVGFFSLVAILVVFVASSVGVGRRQSVRRLNCNRAAVFIGTDSADIGLVRWGHVFDHSRASLMLQS